MPLWALNLRRRWQGSYGGLFMHSFNVKDHDGIVRYQLNSIWAQFSGCEKINRYVKSKRCWSSRVVEDHHHPDGNPHINNL